MKPQDIATELGLPMKLIEFGTFSEFYLKFTSEADARAFIDLCDAKYHRHFDLEFHGFESWGLTWQPRNLPKDEQS